MDFLKNMKVKTKLISSFIAVAFLITVVGVIGAMSLKKVNSNSNEMYSNNLQSVYILTDMKENLTEIKNDMLQLGYVRDASKKEYLMQNIKENQEEDNKYIESYEKLPTSASEKELWLTFKDKLEHYRTSWENVVKLVNDNKLDEAAKEYQQVSQIENDMFDTLSKLVNENLKQAEEANTNNQLIFAGSNRVMLILMIAGLILAVAMGLIISRDINVPLIQMMNMAENLAKYDFSHEYKLTRGDEFGKTGGALVKAQENIRQLVRAIMDNSQDMSASSEELSAVVEEMASKFENIDEATKNIANSMQETSASSEEVSASVEEVDSSINELSEKAMEGSNNASRFKDRAMDIQKQGKAAIKETTTLYAEKEQKILKAIEDGKVVDNIKVMADTIANIASQTNLLALNAAIEAARAGEEGRGFAVVAEEVRKLAEQSSKAVSNIQDTIVKVQDAFKNLSDNSSEVLKFIHENVNPQFEALERVGNEYYSDSDFVSRMSEEIASMTEEIAATVGQVNEVVCNMAEMAQKSSENGNIIKVSISEATQGIDQVSSTAQAQAELAQKLNEMIQEFKI